MFKPIFKLSEKDIFCHIYLRHYLVRQHNQSRVWWSSPLRPSRPCRHSASHLGWSVSVNVSKEAFCKGSRLRVGARLGAEGQLKEYWKIIDQAWLNAKNQAKVIET